MTRPSAPPLSDVELLRRLVGFDTVSANPNAPLADWIADYLDRPGVRIERQPGEEPGKVNLIVRAGPEGDEWPENDGTALPQEGGMPARRIRPGLTLSAHLDTVPADESDWTSDPFTLEERGDRLVARGSCDMKGFVALAVNRMATVDPTRLLRPLALLLTFDEEIGCLGAAHFTGSGSSLPTSVWVGEPTRLRVVRMHKGHMRLKVVVRGKAAHTGSPHLGINAVEGAIPVLAGLARLRRQWEQAHSPHAAAFGEVPFAVLAAARIRGGEAVNVVPDRCEIDVGIRLMPGMDSAAAVQEVRDAIRTDGAPSPELQVVNDSPPLLTRPDAPLLTTLQRLTGESGDSGVSFASDGGVLAAAGYDCVLFGPGDIGVAHRADEYLLRSEMERAGRVLDAVIADLGKGRADP